MACAPANRTASRLIGRALRLSNGAASRLGAFRPTVHAGTSAPPAALAPVLAYQRPFFLTGVRLALSAGGTATPPGGGRWAEPGGGRGPGGVAAMAESDWDTVTVLRKKGPSAAQAKSKQVGAGSGGNRVRGRAGGRGPGLRPQQRRAHLRSFPRRSWRPSGAARTWRPPRSVGIPVRCEAGARGGERGREAAPPGWAREPPGWRPWSCPRAPGGGPGQSSLPALCGDLLGFMILKLKLPVLQFISLMNCSGCRSSYGDGL